MVDFTKIYGKNKKTHYYWLFFGLFFLTIVLVAGGLYFSIYSFQSTDVVADTVNTSVTVNNVVPAFTAAVPHEDAISHSGAGTAGTDNNPTNVGADVTFKATATDSNGDQWKLLVCKSAGTTGVACTGNTWCNSTSFIASNSENTCAYTVLATDTSQSYAWFGYACDGTGCSTVSQGSANPGSPFYVNHRPGFTVVGNDGPTDPGDTATWTSTASDADSTAATDTVQLFVCTGDFIEGATPGCDETDGNFGLCDVNAVAASNPTCEFNVPVPMQDDIHDLYAYVVDNHGFSAQSATPEYYYTSSALFYNYSSHDYGLGSVNGTGIICSSNDADSCVVTNANPGGVTFDKGEDGSHDYNVCLLSNAGYTANNVIVVRSDYMADSNACLTLWTAWGNSGTDTVRYFQTVIFDSNGAGVNYSPNLGVGLTIVSPPAQSPSFLTANETYPLYLPDSLTIANVAPEVTDSSIVLRNTDDTTDPLQLTVADSETTGFGTTMTVVDNNGCENADKEDEISSVAINVYRSGVTSSGCDASGEYNGNNCYPEAYASWAGGCTQDADTCTFEDDQTDTSTTWTCSFPLQYHADPTVANSTYADNNWLVSAQATDDDAGSSSLTQTDGGGNEMAQFLYHNLASNTLNYGTIQPNADSAEQTMTIQAYGNVGVDETLYGIDMASGGNHIDVGQQVLDLTAAQGWASGTALLVDPGAESELNCAKTTVTATPAHAHIYWQLRVPTGQPAGSYAGLNTIVAKTGEYAAW